MHEPSNHVTWYFTNVVISKRFVIYCSFIWQFVCIKVCTLVALGIEGLLFKDHTFIIIGFETVEDSFECLVELVKENGGNETINYYLIFNI